jgi:hypothetical protein
MGFPFMVWILSVLLVHLALGYSGYSKVLRYIILVTPAYIILFSLVVNEALKDLLNNGLTPKVKKAAIGILTRIIHES